MSDEYKNLIGQEWLRIKDGAFWKIYSDRLDKMRREASRICELPSTGLESIRFQQGIMEACDRVGRMPEQIINSLETAGKK